VVDFNEVADKPHAVCLHFKGFQITFVNTEYSHKRLLKSRGSHSLDGLLDFQFEATPDGLLQTEDSDRDIPSVCESIAKNRLVPFRNLLHWLNDSTFVFQSPTGDLCCF